jgi:hypothetical protein
MRGWFVQAFDDFEKALHWLSEHPSEQMEQDEQEIPVRLARRKVEIRPTTERSPRNRTS